MSIQSKRNAVLKALQTKIPEKTAKKYEVLIYRMCKKLANRNEYGNLEEVYTKYSYEKIGSIMDAKNKKEQKCIIQDTKNVIIGWNGSSYKGYQLKENANNQMYTKEIHLEEGEFPCRNKDCQSMKCYYYQSQDRGGDEAMSVYVVCSKCGTRYKFN